MAYVVSFQDYRPTPRYDDTIWTSVRIEEAAESTGTWATIDTQVLAPVDTDPENPLSRNFTTEEATLADGWYRVVFLDASGDELYTSPVAFAASPSYTPSVAEVGALLRARTKDTNGVEVGTFTDDTRPTAAEVERLITQGTGDVAVRVGASPAVRILAPARSLSIVRSAMLIELSYFPEQIENGQSAYESLRRMYEDGIGNLVDGGGTTFGSIPITTLLYDPLLIAEDQIA